MHDNVPDRPSAKAAPVGCQLATMALNIKTLAVPKKVGLHGRGCHPNPERQCISLDWVAGTRLAEFLIIIIIIIMNF